MCSSHIIIFFLNRGFPLKLVEKNIFLYTYYKIILKDYDKIKLNEEDIVVVVGAFFLLAWSKSFAYILLMFFIYNLLYFFFGYVY